MKCLLRVAFVALLFTGVSNAGNIIQSVTAISSSVTPTVDTLVDGINIYHDRSPGHRLFNVPTEFGGDADVIVTSNSDKTRADFQLEVTTSKLGIIYVGLDDRHAASTPLPWMNNPAMTGLPTEFFNTGRQISIDEGSTADNFGVEDQTFTLWAALAPAGTYNFFEQTFGGGSNNYFIAADNKLVPEPSCVLLVGLGIGALGFARRRRS